MTFSFLTNLAEIFTNRKIAIALDATTSVSNKKIKFFIFFKDFFQSLVEKNNFLPLPFVFFIKFAMAIKFQKTFQNWRINKIVGILQKQTSKN
jgi:hypothetical protein